MNKAAKIFIIGVFLCVMPFLAANAQSVNINEFRAYGVMPFGKFAKSAQDEDMIADKETASAAYFGAGLGYRYNWQFSWNMEFFAGIDFFWNPVSPERKEEFSNNALETPPHYLNIPVTVGLNLISPLTETFTWYFNVGAGVNISQTTSTGWIDHETFYKPGLSAAITASAGIILNSHYTFGLSVMSLGSYEIKVKDDSYENISIYPTSGMKRSVLIGTLHVGYRF